MATEVNPEANIIVSEVAIYTTGRSAAAKPALSPAKKVKDPVQETDDKNFAKWGDSNLFPQEAVEYAELSTLIKPVIEWKTQALYGGGLEYGIIKDDKFIKQKHPDVDAFMKKGGGNRYIMDAIAQFYYFYNVFPRIDFTANLKKAATLSIIDCCWGRWGVQDQNDGLIKKLFVSGNWLNTNLPDDAVSLPVIDPYFDPEGQVKEGNKFTYIYPISYPSPGKIYYSLAAWHTSVQSKWFTLLKQIPEFKTALLKNQATIKYHVEIHRDFWDWKYKNFYDLDTKEQLALKKKEIEEFEKKAFGLDNTGNTIMTSTYTDPKTNEIRQHWKITAIDNKILSGAYIEDSQEAADHIIFSMGLDGTLIGKTPGKSMGSGSGSDKRVAFNVYINNCKMHEDIILEPLFFISRYNGWMIDGEEITFRFKRNEITTLNTGTETKTVNTPAQ